MPYCLRELGDIDYLVDDPPIEALDTLRITLEFGGDDGEQLHSALLRGRLVVRIGCWIRFSDILPVFCNGSQHTVCGGDAIYGLPVP